MPIVLREILIILLLVLANGVFAMSEAAVIASRKARLQERANDGDVRARAALELAESPNDFLSTVQIGITLIGILAGAFGGATLAELLSAELAEVPALAPFRDALALAVVVGAITFASLVIGELVPKRFALSRPEGIASRIAGPMRTLSALTMPFVRVLSVTTDLFLRLLGAHRSGDPPVTEEEVKILLQEGAEAGVFLASEQQMVKSVFRLSDLHVNDLMTPRPRVVWLDVNDPPEENRRKMEDSGYSQFPVADDTLDNLLGMVSVKALWARGADGAPQDLRDLLWQPPVVPENAPALKALDAFRQTGHHVAVVIDEYGGVAGIVALMDVLEAIVGDLPSAPGVTEQQAVQREDGSWLLDGMLPVDDVKDTLSIRSLPEEDESDYATLGGFMLTHMQHIPAAGDSFEWGSWRWEVMDMDGRRVDKVLVTPLPPADGDGAG